MPRGRRPRELLVAGHVVVDRYLRVAEMPRRDRTVPVLSERVELGGTATHLAQAAARAGVRVGLLSRVGAGLPTAFRAALRKDGIDLRGLTAEANVPTPSCTIVEQPDGVSRTFFQQGPMGDAPVDAPGPWWRTYRWVHLATGPPEYYRRLAEAAKREQRHVAFDPAQEIFYRWDRRRFLGMLPYTDLLFGNRAEVARAAGWAGGVAGLLARLPLVVRTEGANGATAFYRGGSVHIPGARARRARTFVGAGDAFRGGFYGAWFDGAPLRACLLAGQRSAAARIAGGA